MKSVYYLATVVSSYRTLIDLYEKQGYITDAQKQKIKDEIAKAENRPTGPGFYEGLPDENVQLYRLHDETVTQEYVAQVIRVDKDVYTLQVKNKFTLDDDLEIFGPSIPSTPIHLEQVKDLDENILTVCNKPMQIIQTHWQGPVEVEAMIRKRRTENEIK